MDATQVLYLKAALLIAFALTATVVVSVIAWPANRYLFGLFVAWCRGLRVRWSERRDPAARARRETVERYENVLGMLEAGEARRRAAADDGKREARILVASAYLRSLTDADLDLIAAHLDAAALGGRAGAASVRAFLAEERALAAATPWAVTGHARRFIGRFKAFAPEQGTALANPEGKV